jgi:hypothetical protein
MIKTLFIVLFQIKREWGYNMYQYLTPTLLALRGRCECRPVATVRPVRPWPEGLVDLFLMYAITPCFGFIISS